MVVSDQQPLKARTLRRRTVGGSWMLRRAVQFSKSLMPISSSPVK